MHLDCGMPGLYPTTDRCDRCAHSIVDHARVTEVEREQLLASPPPLVFSSTGEMGEECNRYQCRLAEEETYSTTISWIRPKVSFALVRGGTFMRKRF